MTILCWNCQGIGNPWTVKGLKRLVSLLHPKLNFLSETRCTVREIDGVRRQVGWKNAFSVSCRFEKKSHGKRVSRARGICLLWTDDIRVSLKSYSENHIDVMVRGLEDDQEWRFTDVYGEPRAENRHQTWSLIKNLGREKTKMWEMGGDFNEIASSVEKEGGGALRPDRQMEAFKEALEECELADLRFVGPSFTWKGNVMGNGLKSG
ncbi:hypothetical protein ACLB2K_066241 [Fragaria x ananassa]